MGTASTGGIDRLSNVIYPGECAPCKPGLIGSAIDDNIDSDPLGASPYTGIDRDIIGYLIGLRGLAELFANLAETHLKLTKQ
jgi:hypothetical protein